MARSGGVAVGTPAAVVDVDAAGSSSAGVEETLAARQRVAVVRCRWA
jgi:hypothetical protein